MGIEGLYPFIHKNVPGCNKQCTLSDFSGKKICFDGNAFVYKYRYGNRDFTHIIEFGRLVVDLKKLGITPVFVFDGEHPEEKSFENAQRDKKKKEFAESVEESRKRLKNLKSEYGYDPERSIDHQLKRADVDNSASESEDDSENEERRRKRSELQRREDELEEHSSSQIVVTSKHIKECMEILKELGVWVLQAPSEGEAYASLLNRLGIVDYIAADDSDVFPFGGLKLIRNIGWRSTRSERTRVYDIVDILSKLKLDRKQFIDVCVLCQNDYNKECRINGIGIDKSSKAIRDHGTIENFFKDKLKNNDKIIKSKAKKKPKLFEIPIDFKYDDIRKIFHKFAFEEQITEELAAGNPYQFDLERCIAFFLTREMDYFLPELLDWATVLQYQHNSETDSTLRQDEIIDSCTFYKLVEQVGTRLAPSVAVNTDKHTETTKENELGSKLDPIGESNMTTTEPDDINSLYSVTTNTGEIA